MSLPQYSRVAELFLSIESACAALLQTKSTRLGEEFALNTLVLADAAGELHLAEVQQTARSMGTFLDGLRERELDEQDRFQLKALFDNLSRAYHRHDALAAATVPLVTPIAPRASSENDRVALYIESRAIAMMIGEVLRRNGFVPFTLESMKELDGLDEHNYPAAVVADQSLCLRDPDTAAAILALRERFTPPPHLFALAGGADVNARLQAVRLGATRFMKKPVDTDKLIAVLKGVTERSKVEPFRILFVDDDRALTGLYCTALEQCGAEVRAVNDPLEAPRVVATFAPDVIVTDVYMPGCNGLELAALLRQDEAIADTPILFLSSETNIQRQMAALDLGGDDFLTKPVNLEVLQAAVIARAKRARMLKRSRREYWSVVEHLQRIEMAINQHSIVSVGDLEGNILYANQYFCEISGYTQSELIGANHRIVKSGVHPAEFYRHMWETISAGKTWRGEVCNRRKDGSHYWVDATITPQLDENGRPVRYVSVRTDITALKEMQARMKNEG